MFGKFRRSRRVKGTIFIVTYGRSGSTLLQSLLQTIPGAHITGENHGALEHLFRASKLVRETRQKWGKRPRAKNHPWYGAWGIRPDRFDRRLVEAFTEEVLNPPASARWYGFKEIRYTRLGPQFEPMLDFMRENFPNAHFVFNMRDGEAVSKSRWWGRRDKDSVLAMVRDMDEAFAAYAGKHPACSHLLRYEDFSTDPAALQPLFDALDEPLDLDKARAVLSVRLTH